MNHLPDHPCHTRRPPALQPHRLGVAIFLAAICGMGDASAHAIEIVDLKWGFDGTAQPETFAPLYVLVRNDKADGFVGQFVLNKHDALGSRVGAPLVRPVALAPSQQNWIRFNVYLENGDVVEGPGQSTWNWRLQWSGNQKGSSRLEVSPRRGPPARVMLLPRGDVIAGGSFGITVLIDELFPASVTTTDALGTVFLDHVPRWQDSQRRAFTDWLRRGGHVQVLHDSTGRHPRFPSSLGLLNPPDPDTPPLPPELDFGNGTVDFHARGRFDVDPVFVNSVTKRDRPNALSRAETEEAANGVGADNFGGLSRSSDMAFFSRFKQMTTPDHNWLVIFALAGLYWLLLFPGGLILGLKRIDYRIVLGSILGTIALFSIGFSWIGARAYDEATVVNSLAAARHLGGNRWDVQQWSALFVLDGDQYTISHSEPDANRSAGPTSMAPAVGSQLYAVPGGMNRVPGSIHNGVHGSLNVAIPPYTLRPFLHRVALAGPQWTPTVIDWQVTSPRSAKITIALTASTNAPQLHEAWVQYGSSIRQLSIGPDSDANDTTINLVQGSTPATDVKSIAFSQDFSDFNSNSFPFSPRRTVGPDKLYKELIQPLLARTIRWIEPDPAAPPLRIDRLRLFLVTDLPESFHVKQPQRTGRAGRAMFVLDTVAPVRAEISASPSPTHAMADAVTHKGNLP